MSLGFLGVTYWATGVVARGADAFLVRGIEQDLSRVTDADELGEVDLRSLLPADIRRLQVTDPALFRQAILGAQHAGESGSAKASRRAAVQFMFGARLERLLVDLRTVLGGGVCLFALALMLVLRRGRHASPYRTAGRWICASTWLCFGALAVSKDWVWSMLTAHLAGEAFLAFAVVVLFVSFDAAFNEARLARRLVDLLWYV